MTTPNRLTAERAREIARSRGFGIKNAIFGDLEQTSVALAIIDTAIETLEAWLTEHRSIRTHWMEYGKSDDCHECVAIEDKLTRLRAEREKLNSSSPPTICDGPKAQSGVGSPKHEKVRET